MSNEKNKTSFGKTQKQFDSYDCCSFYHGCQKKVEDFNAIFAEEFHC